MIVPGNPRLSELLGNLRVVLDFSQDDPSIPSIFDPKEEPKIDLIFGAQPHPTPVQMMEAQMRRLMDEEQLAIRNRGLLRPWDDERRLQEGPGFVPRPNMNGTRY